MGDLCETVARAHRRQIADHPAQSRRLAAQRYIRRHFAAENDLGAALLRRLLAACAERAFAGADRPRRFGPDGRIVLGSWRSGDATAAAPRLSVYSAATAAFVCCACFSISRRMRTACELSSSATSAAVTNSPAATLRTSLTWCASPIGKAPSFRLRAAGMSLA